MGPTTPPLPMAAMHRYAWPRQGRPPVLGLQPWVMAVWASKSLTACALRTCFSPVFLLCPNDSSLGAARVRGE